MARAIPPCVNCACNTRGALTGCFTFSILAAWRFCCWVATKPAMTAGTRKTYRCQISFTTTILPRWRRKTMPKTTKFSELRAKMSPEARAEARRLADQDLKEMPLHELRAARHLTQQQLAQTLNMTQAAVSQLEQRTDIYLSTLENFVEAMGGRLEMYAVFPDGKVKLGLDREAS